MLALLMLVGCVKIGAEQLPSTQTQNEAETVSREEIAQAFARQAQAIQELQKKVAEQDAKAAAKAANKY